VGDATMNSGAQILMVPDGEERERGIVFQVPCNAKQSPGIQRQNINKFHVLKRQQSFPV